MKQKTNVTPLQKIGTSKEKDDRSVVSSLSPREIVSELDRYVIGQQAAKRAVAIADKEKSFIISGTGDVLEPEEGIIGIGSGGNYALAAAKVLMDSKMSAEEIAKKSIQVASEICVYTNSNITLEKI